MLALVVATMTLTSAPPHDLVTVAERSGWQATATHAEVMDLARRIDRSSSVTHLGELGRTVEGRPIPLLVLARPPVETAAQAAASGKAIVFAFGGIHAGEVCGKEALLMLAREIAGDPKHPLLDDLIVVLAPLYNADGNERVSPDNRHGQKGPAAGMGERPNAQGLDLNRDYTKLESPEARALVRFLTAWDPHLTIDTHTTNGSVHRYALTYAAPLNPSGHPESILFVRDELLPEVTTRLRARTGYDTFFYGNFNEERTVWRTYSASPRFGGPYRGLRGQMSILSEAYSYASYEDRVLATREFVREILTFTAGHRDRIIALHDDARAATFAAGVNPQPDDTVGIRHRVAAFDAPAVIAGFVDSTRWPKDYPVVHLGRFEATRSVGRPYAYLIEPGLGAVVENLHAHGIETEPFAGTATVETYTVRRVNRAEEPFQGHHLVALETDAALERRVFEPGSVLARTAQPLGTLLVYLLEPEADDGLAAWNFFDGRLGEGRRFPVARVRSASDLDQ